MLSIRHTREIVDALGSGVKNSWKDVHADICRQIMAGEIVEGGELPSVRGLAAEKRAHHSTIRKAYDTLCADGIIAKRVGKSPIVARDGRERLRAKERRQFRELELPSLLRRMEQLDFDWDDLKAMAPACCSAKRSAV